MPHRYLDQSPSDAISIVQQLEVAGREVQMDVNAQNMSFSRAGYVLDVDFSQPDRYKVTSHIGDQRIDHPTLRAGLNTLIAEATKGTRA